MSSENETYIDRFCDEIIGNNSNITVSALETRQVSIRTRGRHRLKFCRYPVPIGAQKFCLGGTRYPSLERVPMGL